MGVAMGFAVSTWNWAAKLKAGQSYGQMLAAIKDSALGIEFWLATMSPEDVETYLHAYAGSFPLVSCHTSLANQFDEATLKREIVLCNRLGASVLVVHPCSLGFAAHTWDAAYTKAVDAILMERVEEYGELAKANHVVLALENGPVEVLTQVMDLVKAKGLQDRLGICIDTGHASMHAKEDPTYLYALLERFLPHLVQLHVHDNHGVADDHLVPGTGCIDWQRVFALLNGVDIPIVFELKNQSDPLQSALESIRFIERL